jgi:hypothetical protein
VPAAAQPRSYRIERFEVTLDVRADASLVVREAITFRFEGQHRGVYRVIPVRYTRSGLDFALRLDGIQALDEGHRPLRTEVSYPPRYVRIKAWVPDAADAARTVVFVYRVRRALFPVEDHQELYWNVTGDEWEVPIQAAVATVASPVPLGGVRSIAYTGARGQSGGDYVEERRDGYLVFRATRPLRPREGLTVAVAWPAGSIARPPAWRQAVWYAEDNWPLGLPFLTLALGLVAWRRYGRDPAIGRSIRPEYAPPAELSVAEAGALLDERVEPRDVVATLVDLAVRGYLRIEEVGRAAGEPDFRFRRLKPIAGDPAIRPFELLVLARVFGADWSLNDRLLSHVRRDYDNVFPPLRDNLLRMMVRDRLFPTSPDHVRRVWALLGGVLVALGVFTRVQSPDWLPVRPSLLAWGIGLSGLVLIVLSPVMPRRSWHGARLLARVRGFQEFLERAEKDRLARLPAGTLHEFLPWAIALGVAERWIWNFEGLPVSAPTWYQGEGPFSLETYNRAVTAFGDRTAGALVTTRRAGSGGGWSGGGGTSGGSSGGGMGGGGGGTF